MQQIVKKVFKIIQLPIAHLLLCNTIVEYLVVDVREDISFKETSRV